MINCGPVFVRTVEILIESDIKHYRQKKRRDAGLDLILLCMLRYRGEGWRDKKWLVVWKREQRKGQSQGLTESDL